MSNQNLKPFISSQFNFVIDEVEAIPSDPVTLALSNIEGIAILAECWDPEFKTEDIILSYWVSKQEIKRLYSVYQKLMEESKKDKEKRFNSTLTLFDPDNPGKPGIVIKFPFRVLTYGITDFDYAESTVMRFIVILRTEAGNIEFKI